jgi:hypothetical protein
MPFISRISDVGCWMLDVGCFGTRMFRYPDVAMSFPGSTRSPLSLPLSFPAHRSKLCFRFVFFNFKPSYPLYLHVDYLVQCRFKLDGLFLRRKRSSIIVKNFRRSLHVFTLYIESIESNFKMLVTWFSLFLRIWNFVYKSVLSSSLSRYIIHGVQHVFSIFHDPISWKL